MEELSDIYLISFKAKTEGLKATFRAYLKDNKSAKKMLKYLTTELGILEDNIKIMHGFSKSMSISEFKKYTSGD